MAVPVTTGFTNVSAPESFLHADPNDRFAVRDTVVAKDRAGEVVIIQLPDFVAGSLVERYQMVRTPPLSWLSGRSFFWRTTTGEIGVHDLLFRAVLVDGRQEQLLIEVSLLPTRTN